jgi:small-conductance mechanosensitive channel
MSVFGLRRIHYALAIAGIAGIFLALYELTGRRSDTITIAQCCWIVIALVLSEISFFTSPLTEAVRLTELLLVEKVYALLYIFVVVRLLDVLIFRSLKRRSGEGRTTPVMIFVARASLYFLGAAVFYTNILGRDILPVLATSSVLLTVVGLALRELIFDAMAGVALTTDRHIRIGEWISVRVRDRLLQGKVEGVGWRHTRIRSRDNQTHFIPNSAIATQVLSNLSVAGGYTRMECSFVVSARVNEA